MLKLCGWLSQTGWVIMTRILAPPLAEEQRQLVSSALFALCWVGATVSATLTKVNLSKDSVRMKRCPLFAGGTFIIFYL